ncbi:hypothetical protein MGH68_01780 [Erysipelothrix sp. D19-032]
MEKLIKDSDIKTMENKLNILTLIVLVTSSLTLLFIDGDILSSTSMPVLNTVSIFLRILLIGLLFYTIIKYVKMRNDYQRQNGNENQPKYNTTKVIIVLAGLCVIGFLLGLFLCIIIVLRCKFAPKKPNLIQCPLASKWSSFFSVRFEHVDLKL